MTSGFDPTDAELLARFRQEKDERALGDLYKRHIVAVRAACRSAWSTPDRTLAQTAADEGLLKALRRCDPMRSDSFRAYWVRCAINYQIDIIRAEMKKDDEVWRPRIESVPLEDAHNNLTAAEDVSVAAADSRPSSDALQRRAAAITASFTTEEAVAVQLRRHHTQDEMATMLDQPRYQVNRLLAKARTKIGPLEPRHGRYRRLDEGDDNEL